MADFNITDPEIIKMLKGLTEEGRQGVADQLQESLNSGEVKKIIEDTKGIHPEPSEDSLVRELGKEKHSPDCKWHKDWHACDCGAFDEEDDGVFICDVCGKKHNSMERHTLKTEQLSGVVMCEDCSGGNTTDRVEEDILDDEDEQLYDRLIKEIIAECHSETLDWDEDRMRARLRRVLETT